MSCLVCAAHHANVPCERLAGTTRTLESFGSPAYVTDPLNRILHVNTAFARLVGDPNVLGMNSDERFIPALFMGAFRDRLPRRYEEVSQCLGGLDLEIEHGSLSVKTRSLVDKVLAEDDHLARLSGRAAAGWDGTIVVRNHDGRMELFRETVVPLTDSWGRANRFHISVWTFAERHDHREMRGSLNTLAPLTRRQREVCLLYATGLSVSDIAQELRITPRTARDHIEASYARLDIHSRVELVRLCASFSTR